MERWVKDKLDSKSASSQERRSREVDNIGQAASDTAKAGGSASPSGDTPEPTLDDLHASIRKLIAQRELNPQPAGAPQTKPVPPSAPESMSIDDQNPIRSEQWKNQPSPRDAVKEPSQIDRPQQAKTALQQEPAPEPSSEQDNEKKDQSASVNTSRRKYAALLVVVVAVLIGLGANLVPANSPVASTVYRFVPVERADLKVFTVATGRIEAIDAVEVSSQLSGQVAELLANFNDKVSAGAALARLDDKTFMAAVAEAEARLALAQASHESAKAAISGAKARHEEARLDYERKTALAKRGSVSKQEIDKSEAKLRSAQSELSSALAEVAVQQAEIKKAQAALRKVQIDLERTVIRSPIEGVVIKRSIEMGQTVAVSLEAPTLFTIAHDLKEMRLHARVDEADIGRIRIAQNVEFSVDAHPGHRFAGRVVEIRRAPETVQNVVTYTVVITAENPDLLLLPGMTAVARIATIERPDALLVPIAALRFEPENKTSDTPSTAEAGPEVEGRAAQVWVRTDGGGLASQQIGIGASNGSMTEVLSGPLSEGQVVAVGKRLVRNERTLFGIRLGF